MDASTLATVTSAAPDPGAVVAVVGALLVVLGGALGFPWWWRPAVQIAGAAWRGRRALALVKPEPGPDPVSDGGTADDRLIRPSAAPAPHYEVTDPLRPIEPGGGPTGGMGG